MVTPGLTGAAESSTTPVVTGLVRPTNFVVVTRNNDNANGKISSCQLSSINSMVTSLVLSLLHDGLNVNFKGLGL